MASKPLGFGLIGAALIALIIGLFITPHEAGAPHVIGFYVLLAAGVIVLAQGGKAAMPKAAPIIPHDAISEEAPEAAKSLPKAMIVAGAASAAVATAGLVASREERPLSGDDRLLEDLERDLFSDIAPAKPEAALPSAAEPELPLPEQSPANLDAEDLPAEPVFQPVNGLVADADLAALQTGEEPLAPLEGLDVVGAYDSAGTRFTMYSDGSVTALGADLDRRFKSLDALRAYIDKSK